MRVYLPVGPGDLRELRTTGRLEAGHGAYAVTPEVCAELGCGPEDEEGEYAVLGLAAQVALDLVGEVARRAVVVAEVPADPAGGAEVSLRGPVPLKRVQALHVDDAAAESLVRAARAGDDAALAALDGHDLGWFATQELDQVVETLRG